MAVVVVVDFAPKMDLPPNNELPPPVVVVDGVGVFGLPQILVVGLAAVVLGLVEVLKVALENNGVL